MRLRLLSIGVAQLFFFFLPRCDTGFDSLKTSLAPQGLSELRGELDLSLQVGFVSISIDTRNDVLHIARLTRFASLRQSPSLLGFHVVAVRFEVCRCRSELDNVRISVLVFHPSSFRSHTYTRTTCPISFTTRCSPLSSARPTHIDLNAFFRNHEISSRFSADHRKQRKTRISVWVSCECFFPFKLQVPIEKPNGMS